MAARFRQHLPRPDEVRPGVRPPWSALGGTALAHVPVSRVREALAAPGRPTSLTPRAGVLVPVFERGLECWCVLIRRASGLSRNPGEMAFPGGRLEPDETPLQGALREAHEEVGLAPGQVEVLGSLGTFARPGDGWHIGAFVGLVPSAEALVASPGEVEAIVGLPLASGLAPGAAWQEVWLSDGVARPVPFLADAAHLGDDVVWGVTARILWELLARVAAVPGHVPGHVR